MFILVVLYCVTYNEKSSPYFVPPYCILYMQLLENFPAIHLRDNFELIIKRVQVSSHTPMNYSWMKHFLFYQNKYKSYFVEEAFSVFYIDHMIFDMIRY